MALKLNDGERLILYMLGEVYKTLKIKGEIDPDFVMKAVSSGHEWALSSKYSGLFPSVPADPNEVRQTHEILTMFRVLTSSYDGLTAADKKRVDTAVSPYTGKDLKFEGFDGNNENHLGIAEFMVSELGLYKELNGRVADSHSPSLEMYLRMFAAYEPMTRDMSGGGLTADQLITVLKARTHPTRRA